MEDWSPDVLNKVKSEISDTKIVKVKQNLLNHLRAQDNILLLLIQKSLLDELPL